MLTGGSDGGERVLTFTTLVAGLVEIAVVLLVAVLIARRSRDLGAA